MVRRISFVLQLFNVRQGTGVDEVILRRVAWECHKGQLSNRPISQRSAPNVVKRVIFFNIVAGRTKRKPTWGLRSFYPGDLICFSPGETGACRPAGFERRAVGTSIAVSMNIPGSDNVVRQDGRREEENGLRL